MPAEESDFDFLDDIEQLSRFFTQVTYHFINHTNRTVGGSKIRATDLKKFSEDEWDNYYQEHIENYKLICTEYFKNEFVIVEKKKRKTKKEFVIAFKEFLVDFFSQECDGSEEVVADKAITEEGKGLIQRELDSIDDPQQSPEAKMFTKYLSDMLNSLKRHEALPESDGGQEEPRVAGHIQNLDKDFSCSGTDSPSQYAAELPSDNDRTNPEFAEGDLDGPDEIDTSFEQVSQDADANDSKEAVDNEEIMKDWEELKKDELDELEDARKVEGQADEKLRDEQDSFKSDTEMECQTCQKGPEENCEAEPELDAHSPFEISGMQINDSQQTPESQEFTDHLSDMLDSLKRPDTLPDSDGDQLEHIVAEHVQSLDEGFQEVSSSVTDFPSPTCEESIFNLGSEAGLTKLKPLEDNIDEPDEIDPIFEQKLKEQNEAYQKKLEEAKQRREEKQRKFQEELNEIRRKQKLCFTALFACIQLKQRFKQKEQDVSSWINNCYKKPVLKLLRNFEDFRDTAREWKYFKKIPEDSVSDARSEIGDLHGKVYFLLDTLKKSYDQLEQLSGMAPEALFLRVLQKSICDLAEILNNILDILEEHQIDIGWYQKIEASFLNIGPEKIPTTGKLKKICKKENGAGYENLKFPERHVTSSVVISEEDEGEETLEQEEEHDQMECGSSLPKDISTQNAAQQNFQDDYKTDEVDSSYTDHRSFEHSLNTTKISTPNSNRKPDKDSAFSSSSLAMTPTNDFQRDSPNSSAKTRNKHFRMNLSQ